MSISSLASQKLQERDAKYKDIWKQRLKNAKVENESLILSLPVEGLREAVQQGEISLEDIATVYLKNTMQGEKGRRAMPQSLCH